MRRTLLMVAATLWMLPASCVHASTVPGRSGPSAALEKLLANRAKEHKDSFQRYLEAVLDDFAKVAGPDLMIDAVTSGLLADIFQTLDRNADARVTEDELHRSPLARLFRGVEADSDADGAVTKDEMDAAARRFEQSDRWKQSQPYLGRRGVGGASVETVMFEAMRFFRTFDQDQSGALEDREIATMEERLAGLPPEAPSDPSDFKSTASRLAESCAMDKPTSEAELVLLGTYEGEAISTVHTGDPNEVTSAARIIVRPGEKPVYLVLTSYDSMIWKLEGEVGRIEKVVVSSPTRRSGSGVVGVAAAKVQFIRADRGCIRHFTKGGNAASDAVERFSGRTPDETRGTYGLLAASVPQVEFEEMARDAAGPAPDGFDGDTWSAATRFSPAGLMDIDPAAVVSEAGAGRYDVLPQAFGLAQLVASGKLKVQGGRSTYRIVEDIRRFPAGLAGAHSVTFSLAPGVPMPGGSKGHSRLVVETAAQ